MQDEYTLDIDDNGTIEVRWSGSFERTIGELSPTGQGNRHDAIVNMDSIGIYTTKYGAMCAVIANFEQAL